VIDRRITQRKLETIKYLKLSAAAET